MAQASNRLLKNFSEISNLSRKGISTSSHGYVLALSFATNATRTDAAADMMSVFSREGPLFIILDLRPLASLRSCMFDTQQSQFDSYCQKSVMAEDELQASKYVRTGNMVQTSATTNADNKAFVLHPICPGRRWPSSQQCLVPGKSRYTPYKSACMNKRNRTSRHHFVSLRLRGWWDCRSRCVTDHSALMMQAYV